MTTGKTIALTRWTIVGKVMSLLFNILSRLVIAFLPRSKHLLISWLQSPSAVILEPKKIKSVTVYIVSPITHKSYYFIITHRLYCPCEYQGRAERLEKTADRSPVNPRIVKRGVSLSRELQRPVASAGVCVMR